MKFLDKLNLNHILLFPLVVLFLVWLQDGKYLAVILTSVFGFVLYAVFEDLNIKKEHSKIISSFYFFVAISYFKLIL